MIDGDFLIYHHLGLGDHITLSPLVRLIAQQSKTMSVITKEWYVDNVKFLFRDVENINIISCRGDHEAASIFHQWQGPKLNHMFKPEMESDEEGRFFEDGWYSSFGIDPKFRKEAFHVQRDHDREKEVYDKIVKEDNFIFVHDDPSRGYNIDVEYDGQIIRSHDYPEYLLFDFYKILEEAKERHVMYSSFFALMETTDMPCHLHEITLNKVNGIKPNRVKEFASRNIIVV
tara:strand:- start:6785 stop:7474 length:690 start_codon:yes stop_codon:yes gene_type:complete